MLSLDLIRHLLVYLFAAVAVCVFVLNIVIIFRDAKNGEKPQVSYVPLVAAAAGAASLGCAFGIACVPGAIIGIAFIEAIIVVVMSAIVKRVFRNS
ncbi:MAG: hypothetical protein U0939_23455 [Pirellulales bacterium]